MAIWFTADTHFGHANIIRHCNRPFGSVQEMDEALIASINSRVSETDTLYHLGDFAFRGNDPAAYRGRIRCRSIVLILGNHDPQTLAGVTKSEFSSLFAGVHSLLRIKPSLDGAAQQIMLCHYAMRVWDKIHHGSWHLFGHSHGTLPDDPGRPIMGCWCRCQRVQAGELGGGRGDHDQKALCTGRCARAKGRRRAPRGEGA